jgi:hypothetical protein
MPPPQTQKSDGAPSAPPWHPNLRIVSNLPDTKVVRTAFFVNGAAIVLATSLLLVLGHHEWSLHEVNKQIATQQHNIDRDKFESAKAVKLFGDFKAEESKMLEVSDFVTSKPIISELLLRLGQITPKKIAFDSLDFRDTGISIKATVKGAPDRAATDASAYEKQLRTDKVLGPVFRDVNLLTMRRNTTSGRLVIEIFCAYKKGMKKT